MRAIVYDRYGPPEVLRSEELEQPVPPTGYVLVRVRATTVNRSDCAWRAGDHPLIRALSGIRRPRRRVLGSEFAGEIVALGPDVTGFEPGDAVFGVKAYLSEGFGAQAEFVLARAEGALAHKPADLTFEEAAAVGDGALNAMTSLEEVGLREGRRILVYGASGSIGTAAVQLARDAGAEVTGVCGPDHLEVVRSLGADPVIDYTREDFTARGGRWHVIFDAVGKLSFRKVRGSLAAGGTLIATDGLLNFVVLPRVTRWAGGRRVIAPIPRYSKEHILRLKDLLESGRYQPVIDRVYPLDQTVDATRYVEGHHKLGNVVLAMAPDPREGSRTERRSRT
jgi:NADPH:quinone reductase-like Zn-dependent oxidoreductase